MGKYSPFLLMHVFTLEELRMYFPFHKSCDFKKYINHVTLKNISYERAIFLLSTPVSFIYQIS